GADEGYGFFPAAPAVAAASVQPHGRRASDQPATEPVRTGRRDTDKTVQNAHGDNASIRVSIEKVDQLINQVGELVITQAMLAQSVSQLDPLLYQNVLAGMTDLERNTRDLQESVMSIRMMPIGFVFKRFPRMVRDLAAKLGKQVQLNTEGEATELDKGLVEKIADPLTHLIRNSVDHGIEMPDARTAAGKPAQGSVTLRAAHQGGSILIEVIDDGKGLDRAKILAKARERGLAVHDAMTDAEVWMLVFEAGFSTADAITDVSGRGVGMDVVKRNITELGGTVEIESASGFGTRTMVRLPLTLAIIDGMSVGVGDDVYIIPLATVVESLQVSNRAVRSVVGGGYVVEVRDEYLPVVSLYDIFPGGARNPDAREGIMLVVESEGVKNAFLVDELLGQQQVVVKSLEANYRRVPGVSGATILGDGGVALILDVPTLVRMSRH
ncbi:MAG TPA: chemotaxis protein CheW, partial [Burkholderiales bacterium]